MKVNQGRRKAGQQLAAPPPPAKDRGLPSPKPPNDDDDDDDDLEARMIMAMKRQSAGDAAVHVLETLADRHHILPLPRFNSSLRGAVTPVAQCLVEGPRSNHPWLPIGTLGPLLIMGHYNPACSDFMGVPKPFRVEVVITTRMYDERFLDFFMDWSWKSDQAKGVGRRTGGAQMPPETSIKQTLEWFLEHYPFREMERENLLHKLQPLARDRALCHQDIDDLIPQLGIALETMRTGRLAFNPAYAPPLHQANGEALSILEAYHVYPLLESTRTRYWLCREPVDLIGLEGAWGRLHDTPPKVITVLAAQKSIWRRIQHERARIEAD